MKAIVVASDGDRRRLVQTDVDEPQARVGEAVVTVKAISLNNGEVRHALTAAAPGHRPGWDFAGVVERVPAGSALSVGDRVAGLAFQAGWAEKVSVPTDRLGRIPDDLGFEAAATLPVAGLTAALCLGKKDVGTGDRLLVTAATGGVGRYAMQLGRRTGAHVTVFARDRAAVDGLRALGADAVMVGVEEGARLEPFDLVLEGVGGTLLGHALGWLRPRGTVVQFGDAAGDEPTSFNARWFRLRDGGMYGGTTLYGFFLFEELTRPRDAALATPTLSDLAALLACGALDPSIGRIASWSEIDAVARALLSREFAGKAVLTLP